MCSYYSSAAAVLYSTDFKPNVDAHIGCSRPVMGDRIIAPCHANLIHSRLATAISYNRPLSRKTVPKQPRQTVLDLWHSITINRVVFTSRIQHRCCLAIHIWHSVARYFIAAQRQYSRTNKNKYPLFSILFLFPFFCRSIFHGLSSWPQLVLLVRICASSD